MQTSPSALEKLGFPEILQSLAQRAQTEDAKAFCLALKPFRKKEVAREELILAREALSLFIEDSDAPFDFGFSVSRLLNEVSIPGNWLNTADLFSLLKWMRMGQSLVSWLKSKRERCPAIWAKYADVLIPPILIKEISRLFDDNGQIKDSASPKLGNLRAERNKVSGALRQALNRIIKHAVAQGWTAEKEITFRNDRLVIPLNADYKGKVPGFIHDISQSGQTLYVEPHEVLEMNNLIKKLSLDEQAEVLRLLVEVSALIRENVPALASMRHFITRMDFLWAKSAYAQSHQSLYPILDIELHELLIFNGKHPLLLKKEMAGGTRAIPNSIELDPKGHILLISGPNAGGKTVALKMAGLLVLMVQSVIPVPCDDQSRFPWFKEMFVDIGDEQSIQNDLSTYTSHLSQMNLMLKSMDKDSFFLIDEFGSGTDPRMGGAMAEAFLNAFLEKGAFGLISTHYGNLKTFAAHNPGIRNAAMQFDPETLSPTFKLLNGVAGSSFAFEIARKVGVPETLLQFAESRMDQGQMQYESLLQDSEAQKAELDRILDENRALNKELKLLLERNKELKSDLDKKRSKVLKEGKEQTIQILREANRQIDKTIREIREAEAQKEKTKELREQLKQTIETIQPLELPEIQEMEAMDAIEEETITEIIGQVPETGDWVKIKDNESLGQVLDIQRGRAVVRVGDIRLTAKLNQLVKVERGGGSEKPAYRGQGIKVEKMAGIQQELNIIGLRVEQALPILEKFMDDATVGGLKEVRILHGKGTGALKTAVRNYLNTLARVESFEDGHPDFGGAGWTIVKLF